MQPVLSPDESGIALEGLRLANDNILRVYRDGADLTRGHMMSAAMMGAVAFQKGLGAIHSLSHPVGALYNTHHGTTNAVVMATVLDFNRPAIEDRLAQAAAYKGVSGGFDVFRARVVELCDAMAIPKGLGDMGVGTDRIDEMVAMAIVDPNAGGNPVELTLDGAKELFHKGDLMDQTRRLLDVMVRLRDPKTGCPWDIEQTYATIAPHTLEEAYEVVEAIENGDMDELKGELGDLLFQVVYYAQFAREEGHFDFEGIAGAVADKMIARHSPCLWRR